MHQAFPILNFTVGTARNAKFRNPMADEIDFAIKFLLQRDMDRKAAEAAEQKRVQDQRVGDSDIAAEMLKAEAARAERRKQIGRAHV